MWFDGVRQPNTIYVANTSRGKDSTAMLRAIQLMGWPLDMICSVDIWFDEDTPAELPPMVEFKNEYDRKILDWFGIPVTRLCATKRSQTVKVERERESRSQTESDTHGGYHTATYSTQEPSQRSTGNTSTDSHVLVSDGVSGSKTQPTQTTETTSKLTYTDIFYRTVKNPRNGNAWGCSASHKSKETGARPAGFNYGFQSQSCRWCTGELKKAAMLSKDSRGKKAVGVKTGSKEICSTVYGFPARHRPWCQTYFKASP